MSNDLPYGFWFWSLHVFLRLLDRFRATPSVHINLTPSSSVALPYIDIRYVQHPVQKVQDFRHPFFSLARS